MAQIVLRNIEQSVKARLQLRAKRNGRTLEQEVREILRSAVLETANPSVPSRGLGTEIASLFSKDGLTSDIRELRGDFLRSLGQPKPRKFKKKVKLPIIDSKRPGWLRLTNRKINKILFP
jgi:plasmid stability protein